MKKNLLLSILAVFTLIMSVLTLAGNPVLTIPNFTISEDSGAHSFLASSYSSHPYGYNMTYGLSSGDSSKVVCTKTGTDNITYIPQANFAGTSSCTVTAVDQNNSITSQTFYINVLNDNSDFSISSTSTTTFTSNAKGNRTESRTITITNNGENVITNLNMSNNLASKYELQVSPSALPSILAVGDSTTITVSVKIPTDETSGEHSIGNIAFSGNGATAQSDLRINPKSYLEISKVKVKVGSQSSDTVSNGNKIPDEAAPGETVKFTIEVDNQLSDLKIENVFATLTVYNIDDGDDLEEESDEQDIKDGKSETYNLEITVPYEVDEDTFAVEIIVEGTDEDGVDYEDKWTSELKVVKDKHNVMITRANLGSSTLECLRSTSLDVQIMNIGRDDEDYARLTVRSSELGLNEESTYELVMDAFDDDNNVKVNYPITLSQTFAPGIYYIDVRAYYDTDRETDSKIIPLTVAKCNIDQNTNTDTNNNNDNVIVDNNDDDDVVIVDDTTDDSSVVVVDYGTTQPVVVEPDSVENKASSSTPYLILLVLLNAFVVIIIIGLVVKFLK